MDTSAIIVVAIIVLGLTAAVLWKKKIWPFKKKYVYSTEQLPVKWPETFASYYYTPQGVNCNFEDPMTQEAFDLIAPVIDMGVRNCIRGCLPQWTKAKVHGDYIIGFIKPTATNQDGSPALMVNGVQSAGTILGYNAAFSPPTIVLPQVQQCEFLRSAVKMHRTSSVTALIEIPKAYVSIFRLAHFVVDDRELERRRRDAEMFNAPYLPPMRVREVETVGGIRI